MRLASVTFMRKWRLVKLSQDSHRITVVLSELFEIRNFVVQELRKAKP